MMFAKRLTKGRLVSTYKRFFAEVELDTGETVLSHCPNPGKMLGLLEPGTEALVTHVDDPKKKLQYRLEALREHGIWVGVNTQWPNRLVSDAIRGDMIPELGGYPLMRPEVKYGHNSRIDWLLQDHPTRPDAYVEIKNVHYSRAPGLAEFPDCVTERGAKHLHELIEMVPAGYRAVVVFCVQRDNVVRFDISRDLDRKFGAAYDAARAGGVEFYAHAWTVSEAGIAHSHALEI
ncbi:DNA/RNA nuclease SfsA [Asticcacaulis sp. YBE204]|uniref:DNA/RNA nuclease SfsA n=1 Tax=Asticcacaulis sp. YBE204 TaxID=1282363 RepID=UPI0003C403C6|nr:DNA/RNA nuclease SfsA [Asticcacaulis sp. YBE204]ESQ77334.1 hypothetical protein AEYBE204_17560 [Asticcacaulis sp. YBE204]